jgi:WD40 repeat protein
MFTIRPAREIRTNALAFSPDGTRLATCGEKGDGRIWDLAARKPAAGFSTGRRSNDDLFFGAGGKEVFVLTRLARLLAWNVETRGWRHVGGEVRRIVPLPGGERALCGHDQSLSLRVLDTFASVWTYDLATEERDGVLGTAALACSGDGQRVACAHVCGRLSLLDAANGELLLRLGDTGGSRYGPKALALSPDGRAAVWCASSNLYFLPLPDGPRVHHRLGRTHFLAIAWHPGGAFFATANGDGKVDFWDATTGQRRESFEWGTGKLLDIAFDATGDRAACCAESGEIVVWDVDH